MQNYVDFNRLSAQDLLLDIVLNSGCRSSLEGSLIEELTEEPSRIFKAIDTLWDYQESVPRWLYNAISRILEPKSPLPSKITYAVLAREVRRIIEELRSN